jgi:hypothetical protein
LNDWEKDSTCDTSATATGTKVGGHNYANFSGVSTVTYRHIDSLKGDLGIPYSTIRNKTITISFYAASPDATKINGDDKNYLLPVLSLHAKGNTSRTKYRGLEHIHGQSSDPLTTSWKRFSYTVNITDDWFTSGTGDIVDTDIVFF